MIEPKEVSIITQVGVEKAYTFSKFPAIAGREIVAAYPVANIPKLGDYKASEEAMLKLMAHVSVTTPGGALMLTTRALVDNHVPDWETLLKIEMGMLEYNCSFFGNGKTSLFFEGIAQNFREWTISMLTALSAASSKVEKQP